MTANAPLIALVPKARADTAIRQLKDAGAYDSNRRIWAADADHLALPITRAPADGIVTTVRTDPDPAYRIRDLDDRLRVCGFNEDERDAAPGSWAVIGTVIVVKFDDCPRESEVGDALLELHRSADTVIAHEGIEGAHRIPEIRVVAGVGETETIHREHGTAYAMDLAEVMFSPGNKAERTRMGELVDPDEVVFDMFAGIGYFTLPMARAGTTVIATERNPTAFRYLLENAALNEVTDRIEAYRADCRAIQPRADRVVMGYYDATDYLETAAAALRPGGTVHLHDVAAADDPFGPAEAALAALEDRFEVQQRRVVKSHSPGMVHVVIDAEYRCG